MGGILLQWLKSPSNFNYHSSPVWVWEYSDLLTWVKDGCNTQQAYNICQLDFIGQPSQKWSLYRLLKAPLITSLPNEICNIGHLMEINCSYNKLKQLPNNIGNLIHLRLLDVSHNKLENFPESMSKLINLNYLNCQYNKKLSYLYEFLPNTRISVILCNNCNLTSLPTSIGNLTELLSLNINNNQLDCIPNQMGILDNFRVINCDNNNLPEIISLLCRQHLTKYWVWIYINHKYIISHRTLLDFYDNPRHYIGLINETLVKNEIKNRQTENRELLYLHLIFRNLPIPKCVVKYNIAPFLKKQTKYQMY